MRDNIIKKRIRADEAATKAPTVNRELQKLQQSNGAEPAQEENADWHANDLSGEYQDDSHVCPSCFKKFDRKAVYTSHVQACSDAKCRERVKNKKRKAKEETKMKQMMEFEENSNASETSAQDAPSVSSVVLPSAPPSVESNTNKRKRKRTAKPKKDEDVKPKVVVQKEESNSVDWNLDDEEEKKKLENIKKEIIEDDYKRVLETSTVTEKPESSVANTSQVQHQSVANEDDDEEEKALVIDEKPDVDPSSQFNCPQCDKVFEADDKLKYHLNTYHSRQKRFKCKLCEYQGYRKKDTINHLSYVHNVSGEKDTLENYMESVMKAVDEESLAKQNELKKNQLKIKRRMARERLKQNGVKTEDAAPVTTELTVLPVALHAENKNAEPKSEMLIEFKEPAAVAPLPDLTPIKLPKLRRKSLHTSILIPPESSSGDESMKIPKMFIKTKTETSSDEETKKKKISHRRRDSVARMSSSAPAGSSLLNISKFGKIVKRSSNGDSKEGSGQRPVRNRIKPVRKDFLYDLSDLLKKDADAHREQLIQSTNVVQKRELRKRAMSTHSRDAPGLSSFDDPLDGHSFLSPRTTPTKDDEDIPLMKFKDRNRRMSVFSPPTRSMYPSTPRSPIYKPPPEPTPSNPNAGAAYRMALAEFNANRAALYEPKYLWSICFDQEPKRSMIMPTLATSTPTTSAAASILQKLTGKREDSYAPFSSSLLKPKRVDERPASSLSSTEQQLCHNFDMISVTGMVDTDLDIPESRAINLNPGRNGLVALALEGAGNDVCVLQECSPDTDEDDDDDDDDKHSSSSSVSDEEPMKSRSKKKGEPKTKRSRKSSDKRKSGGNGQRRLTVMQRLQENKIRKSREQLFKRLIMDRQNDDEESPSPVYNLFSES